MEFLKSCDQMAVAVEDAIHDQVGTLEGGRMIRMGADGTPTKLIDQVAEDCIVTYLSEHPLCRTLISEELGKCEFDGEQGTIVLDPVDGTYNAVAGIPFFALSMALALEEGIVAGLVRDLAGGETFTAVKGGGAFVDGQPIQVSGVDRLEKSALSLYGQKFNPGGILSLGTKVRRWRLLGASALELSYTGCGRIDGFIDLRGTLRVTDAAAGILICTEAGGRVSDGDGSSLSFPPEVTVGRCLVASNGLMHDKIIEYLR
ncbi:MAG: bifunctional fructose-bisphosphatase/inositol-phosphate phosphatase [Methanoregulaceae archaeon]|nr:bifunctional fructose-bisphosphatase/inositol-phosphate phosphatase [Methanoregulaceae archaeon]